MKYVKVDDVLSVVDSSSGYEQLKAALRGKLIPFEILDSRMDAGADNNAGSGKEAFGAEAKDESKESEPKTISFHQRAEELKQKLKGGNPIAVLLEIMALAADVNKESDLIVEFDEVNLDMLYTSKAKMEDIASDKVKGTAIIYDAIVRQYESKKGTAIFSKREQLNKIATEAQAKIAQRINKFKCPCGCGKPL